MPGDESAVGVEKGGVQEASDEAAKEDEEECVGERDGGVERREEARGLGPVSSGWGKFVSEGGERVGGCGVCSWAGETESRHFVVEANIEIVLWARYSSRQWGQGFGQPSEKAS